MTDFYKLVICLKSGTVVDSELLVVYSGRGCGGDGGDGGGIK